MPLNELRQIMPLLRITLMSSHGRWDDRDITFIVIMNVKKGDSIA